MRIQPTAFLILILTIMLFSTIVSASGNFPDVRASVRATATVIHPLGITSIDTIDKDQNKHWLVRYPKADGLIMTFSQNGHLIQSVAVDQLDTETNHETFAIIKSIDNLIKSTNEHEVSDDQIVITLISTTQ